MHTVKAKKHLGQHFLKDENIAQKIAETLPGEGFDLILEIGPGMGVLTKYLLKNTKQLKVVEIDHEAVTYLKTHFLLPSENIISDDFLKIDFSSLFSNQQLAVVGNFPYNISTQIVFKILENKSQVPFFSGMFQKEVAERIASQPGSKVYGILSVLAQAFYQVEYLFTVPEHVFIPPPKVKSGVIRLVRKDNYSLPCDEKLFFKIVKTAFGQRRKTLKNSLKTLLTDSISTTDEIWGKRPEQLSVEAFIYLTQILSEG